LVTRLCDSDFENIAGKGFVTHDGFDWSM